MRLIIDACRFLIISLLLIGCDQFDEEAHAEECGTDWIRGTTYKFRCDYSVDPVQRMYVVGDTISVVCRMSDTIYCENSQRYYHIPDFPFRSIFTMWYWPDGRDVLSGLRYTTWELDSVITDRRYEQNSGGISDHIAFRYHGQAPGTGPGYYFGIEIILDTVGTFIIEAMDQLEENDINGRHTNGYMFDCQLPLEPLGYEIQNRLTHEDHLDDYDDQIQQILDDAFEGKSGYDLGGYKWRMERSAAFAFEVR